MLGPFLITVGAILMILGIVSLGAWIGGKSLWYDPESYDRRGSTTRGVMPLLYYAAAFAALVLAPLVVGGILIVYGLTRVM